MSTSPEKTVKENVKRFEDDVRLTGSYAYTRDKLSAQYANGRISEAIAVSYPFEGKRVLDIGCGDGTYTLEIARLGPDLTVGIDPAKNAVEAARRAAEQAGLHDRVQFETGNIYTLEEQLAPQHFDCVVLRGVLHHLPDPERAVSCAASLADTVIILEPNGYNPVLKLLERFSRYHIEHEERSFRPGTLNAWTRAAGLETTSLDLINLVPMFCPDWLAISCRYVQPIVEQLPLLREIACGQCILVAKHR